MEESVLELLDGTVDLKRRRIERGGKITILTAREAELLAYLAMRPGRTVPRDELLTEVWGYAPSVSSRAVDATAARVRAKIERDREKPDHLVTVHGIGYCFVAAGASAVARTNLAPGRRGRVVGRDHARQAIVDQLSASRLHTLVGSPGVGKTTLALSVADDVWESELAYTVWICRCAAARSEDDLVRIVSSALSLGPNDSSRAADRVGQALAGRGPVLLVLDNLEQIARVAADLVGAWLDAAPELRILATSRERLAVGGERVVEVVPLDVDAGRELVFAIAEELGRPLGPEARGDVDTIVARLDGLPLAIELAAARLVVLDPAALVDRLDARFAVLRTRRRDVEPRHTALQATLDWSWELLEPEERAAWIQCAVFHAPFSLDAAEATIALSEAIVLDVLHALRDKSLLHVEADGRFGLLESVRAYLRSRLEEDPDTRPAVRARHGQWFAMGAAPHPGEGPDLLAAAAWALEESQTDVASRLIVRLDHLQRRDGPRTVLASLAEQGLRLGPAPADRARLQLVLGGTALARGELTRAEAHCRAVAEVGAIDDAIRGEAFLELGRIAQRQGHLGPAAAHLERAATLLEGSARGWAWARLGVVRMRSGGLAEARAFHERALVAARDDASLHAFVLASLVAVGLREGSLGEAIDIGQRAIEVAQEAGDRNMEALAAGNLGAVQATRGDLDAAASSYQHALALHRRAGNAAGVCSVLVNLGDLALGRRRLGEASRHLTEALELARQLGERRQEGVATLNLGLVELEERPQRALGRFEEAAAVFEEAGLSRLSAIAESYRGRALLRSGELEQAERVLEAVTQRFDEVGDEMQAALARGHLATVFLERGATAQAAQAWTAVQRAARALSVGEDSELGKLVAGLEGRLGGG